MKRSLNGGVSVSEYICDKVMIEYYSIEKGEWETIRETDCRINRKVMAMLNYVLKHKKSYPDIASIDRILKAFKKAYGHYQEYIDIDGDTQIEYDSISFESMNEVKFKPVAEEIKQFCYIVLNRDNVSTAIIQGLLDVEF